MMGFRDTWKWLKAEFRWRVQGKRYKVQLTEEAQMQFDEAPEIVQEKIKKAIKDLSRNPYSGVRIDSNNVPEAPKVHCEKEDRLVPIWWCMGSFMQGKDPCPELLEVFYDGPNNTAKVKCKAQEGVDEVA